MKKTYEFDANKQINEIIDWIKEYFTYNGNENTKAIVGISGGKDSTIAAALLVRALGADRVVGVMMPNGEQSDIEDSKRVVDILKIPHYTINIGNAYKTLIVELPECNEKIETNLPSRLRMATLYNIAAIVPGGGRVCCTGNRSEAYVGYTTKYGDLAGDFALFTDLTVTEILAIGDNMEELPYDLVHKTPTDGMSGKSDEENLGITYVDLDNYLLKDILPDAKTLCNIEKRHERNRHKACIKLPHPLPHYNPYFF